MKIFGYEINWPKKQSTQQQPQPVAFHGGGGYGYGRQGDGSKYNGGFAGSGRAIMFDHWRLRKNARQAEYDVPQAKAIIDRFADTTVDTGLKTKPTPKFGILGITREQAEQWSEDVAERHHLYMMDKKCHLSETQTGYQLQRSYARWQQRDNDIFVKFNYSPDRRLQNPLQLSFIDPDQIRGDAYTTSSGFQDNDDGINRDSKGRETGYKIWQKNNLGGYDEKTIPARGAKSKRTFMVHGFMPDYAGQGRGYSRFAHALQNFQKITDFDLAHVQKAIAQASMVGYVKPGDKPSSDPFEGMLTKNGARPLNATFDDNPQPDSGDTISGVEGLNFQELPEATNRQPGGQYFTNLQEDEEMKMFENTSPVTDYGTFVDSFVSILSASMSMPIEVLQMKFGTNYSASRAALIMFWRVGQIWIQEMDADFIGPWYESWLSEEIAAGRIVAPGWSDPILRAAWMSHILQGAPMPNIDPQKTAAADLAYVQMGAQTLDDVARNFNGSSGKSNRAKLARELEEMPVDPFGIQGNNETEQQEKKKETDDDE